MTKDFKFQLGPLAWGERGVRRTPRGGYSTTSIDGWVWLFLGLWLRRNRNHDQDGRQTDLRSRMSFCQRVPVLRIFSEWARLALRGG